MGGLFVLLPLLVLYLLLSETMDLVVSLATPIADLFPKETFGKINAPVLVAMILILGVSFIFGLALKSVFLRRTGRWLENTLLDRLPFYAAVKNLSRGLMGDRNTSTFKPAVWYSPHGLKEIVYMIEDHGDGSLTVLFPSAPTSFTGSIKVVQKESVEMLDASLDDASAVFAHWGVGAADLMSKAEGPKR